MHLNRWIHLALAAWLLVSALVLPHTDASRGNTAAVALLIAIVSVVTLFGVEKGLFVNAVFAAWLLVTTLLVEYAAAGTQFHNAVVAILIIALAFVPLRRPERGEPAEQRAPA
jgi:hypothetical protein